jgi:hypothetical protein
MLTLFTKLLDSLWGGEVRYTGFFSAHRSGGGGAVFKLTGSVVTAVIRVFGLAFYFTHSSISNRGQKDYLLSLL